MECPQGMLKKLLSLTPFCSRKGTLGRTKSDLSTWKWLSFLLHALDIPFKFRSKQQDIQKRLEMHRFWGFTADSKAYCLHITITVSTASVMLKNTQVMRLLNVENLEIWLQLLFERATRKNLTLVYFIWDIPLKIRHLVKIIQHPNTVWRTERPGFPICPLPKVLFQGDEQTWH